MPNDTTTRRPFGDTAKRNLMTPEQVFANQGRIPPQATDLEEVVLGALMLEKEAVNEVIDILSPEAFYLDTGIFGKISFICIHLFAYYNGTTHFLIKRLSCYA